MTLRRTTRHIFGTGSAILGILLGAAVASGAEHTISCTAPAASKAVGTTGSTALGPRAYEVKVSTTTTGTHSVVVAVKAVSSKSAADTSGQAQISKVLLRSAYKSEAIAQPVSFNHGATPSEAVATFDEAAVRALPDGDINVILFTADGERLCKVRKQDRGTMLHHSED
jgi:hypothetical protein